MGQSVPEQKDAQGSGVTFQRSGINPEIQSQSENAFKQGLTQAFNQTYGLSSQDPNLKKSIDLQTRKQTYDFGNLYSSSLDPLVQAQLSKSLGDRAASAQIVGQRLASTLGPGNQALQAALSTQANQNAMLSGNSDRFSALTQQREFDVQRRAADVQKSQLELERMGQFNQAQLASANLRNAALQQQFENRLKSTALGQDLLKTLGQGLIATSPQLQGNFTLADLEKIANNPELFRKAYGNLPQGLLGSDLEKELGIYGNNQPIPALPPPTTATRQQPRNVSGRYLYPGAFNY